ncbi:hypothetical protein Lesp02_48140 [Lentzea sp. NBRC 105346]|uniref:hypothetical protein n=1 Tax=Lentzea sp. NBRC 105346 TaxID=3032205 RepID=UPI0024A315BE|nr:hypothetical protein [Lentzea sp. NBRC 105346]GLZ32626.1 hypothetical protein Lesp02_48140 [Lentzea sp. NBRC 105346]
MGWQEELRALDEAVAAGRISPDQHRARRDQLLAAASSGGAQPQRWVATPPAPGDADRTQVVSSGGQQPEADRTQVVRTDADKTQFVQVPAFQQPGPQQTAPPWAAGDQSFGVPGWQSQGMHGPEVFDEGGGKSKLVPILIGVLVLALIGGGVWFFAFRDSGTDAQQNPPSSSAQPVDAPAFNAILPEPNGTPSPKNGEYTVDKAKAAGVISEKDAKAMQAAGVEKVFDKVASSAGVGQAVAAYVAKDEQSAKELAKTLVDNMKTGGWSTVEQVDVPENVTLMKIAANDQFLYRGVYTSGKVTIRVATAGPSTIPDQEIGKKFNEFLMQVLKAVKVD